MEKDGIMIKIQGMGKIYKSGSGETTQVLSNIDLDIKKNDFAIIYGPSGCGKSTLLHHMVGLELPSMGTVVVDDVDITRLTSEDRAVFRAKKIGMVYQFWYWAKALNVLENVAVPLFLIGMNEKEAKEKAYETLKEIGVEKYAMKSPLNLSGGEQQRISIARALVNDPVIIVADEPTGNLDTHNSDLVMQIFQVLNVKSDRTVVMVTHNLAYLPMATKTVAMKDGLVVAGATAEVKKHIKDELRAVL